MVRTPQDRAPKGQPVREVMVGFHFGRLGADMLLERRIGHIGQEKDRALHPPQLTKGFVQGTVPAIDAELAEQHRGDDVPGLNGEHHLHHVLPVPGDQVPVDHLGKQRINMLIGSLGIDPVEGHVLPGAHARQQVNVDTIFIDARAPLENNLVARALKLFIRQRKHSLFYATEPSASIASVLPV